MLLMAWVAATWWRLDPNQISKAGYLPNLITHAKYETDWKKIVTSAMGWNFMF